MAMSRDELLAFVASVLSTLDEMQTGTPESTIYIALGMDIRKWEVVRSILVDCKFVTIKANYVELTAFGKEKGAAINAKLSKR